MDELPPFEEFSEVRRMLAECRGFAVQDIASEYEDSETPLVVFSAHRAPIDAFRGREGWGVVTGDENAKNQTQAIVDAFQRGELKGIALTIQAGGTGLNLTRANNVLFVDSAWNPCDNAQAADRCHRIGTKGDSVNVMFMTSDHPMDQHINRLIREKTSLVDAAVESTAAYDASAGIANAAEQKAAFERALEQAEQKKAADVARAKSERDVYAERVVARRAARANDTDVQAREVPSDLVPELHAAYEYMLSRCDGAVELDGAGFNKPDAVVARKLLSYDLDTEAAQKALWALLRGYRRQLGDTFSRIFV
jgi:hypothetical protein